MINEMTLLAFYQHLYPERLLGLPVVPQMAYNLNRWVCNMSEFGPRGREVGPALHVHDGDFVAQHRRQQLNATRRAAGVTSKDATTTDDVPPQDILFDPNSYGQFLGGTFKSGKRGYQDMAHIVGQAMRTTGCQVEMLCANSSMYLWRNISTNSTPSTSPHAQSQSPGTAQQPSTCYTAPFVFCGTFFPGGWKPPSTDAAQNDTLANVTSSSSITTSAIRNPPWNAVVNLHIHSKNTAHFISQPCECWL
jgi:hypothetical protein